MNTTMQYGGGLQTVIPLQVVYLDFDGERTSYRGEILTIDDVTVEDSGLTDSEIATLIGRLNEVYAGNVLFVAERPQSGDYSTVYVGHTEAFGYRGLAETVDLGNQNRNDNAFVNLRGGESLEAIQQTIAHEVDHLIGALDHGGEGIDRYTARYDITSGVTSTGIMLNEDDSMYISNGGVANSTTAYDRRASIYVESGGVANNTMIGGFISVDGGVVNDTTVWGSMVVTHSGVANNTILDTNTMVVNSSGVANNTTIQWGSMYVESGGVANNTIAYNFISVDGGEAYDTDVWSSMTIVNGMANNTTVNYTGVLTISNGGTVNNTTARGSMTISSGGVANDTVIYSYMFISSGGMANRTTQGSQCTIYVCSGGVANDTILANKGGMTVSNGGVANDTIISPSCTLVISSGGTASIAFNPWMGWVNSSAGAVVTYLERDAACYYGGWSSNFISKGNYFSNLDVTSGNEVIIYSNGIANATTVNRNGWIIVDHGGVANDTILAYEGYMIVSNGGVANNTMVNNGYIYISSGGTASIAFNPWMRGVVDSSAGAVVTYLERDAACYYGDWSFGVISKGNNFSNLNVTNEAIIYSAGIANNTTIDSRGSMFISSGGTANDTNNSGSMFISSGGVANGTIVDWNGSMYVSSGGIANETTVNPRGSMYVSYEGIANETIVNSNGYMYVSSGGIANETIVNSNGYMYVSSGGIANETTVNFGGLLKVESGARLESLSIVGYVGFSAGTLLAGSVSLNGGSLSLTGTVIDEGATLSWNLGAYSPNGQWDTPFYVTGMEYWAPEACTIVVGDDQSFGVYRLADYTPDIAISLCNTTDERLGVLQNGEQLVVGNTAYMLSSGKELVLQISECRVYEDVVLNSGENLLLKGISTAENTVINSGGQMVLQDESVASVTRIKAGGIQDIQSKGTAIDTIIEMGGIQQVENGGVADSTLICSGGRQTVYAGGLARNTEIQAGGLLMLNKYAQAENITVMSGGVLRVDDYDITLIGRIVLGGTLNVKEEANASRAEVVFAVDQRTAGSAVMINDIDLLLDASYSITVSATQTEGTYRLAGNAVLFNRTIQVYGAGNEKLGSLRIGESLQNDAGVYRLLLDSDDNLVLEVKSASLRQPIITADCTQPTNRNVVLTATFDSAAINNQYSIDGVNWFDYSEPVEVSQNGDVYFRSLGINGTATSGIYTVSNIDKVAPTITEITPSTAAPTNQDITIRAAFDDNMALALRQYKLGNGNWLDYTGAVTVTENTTVFFRAVDTAGNEASAQYVVSNIDRIAPDIPAVSADITAETSEPVTVSARFAADSAKNEYSLDGKTWLPYKTGIVMKQNGTVYFRSTDLAGNVSCSEYEVANILPVDSAGPSQVSVTAAINKYNVTISWNRAETQDKVRIAGYEVTVNGKTSIVTGTSLTLKNLPVSTGNTVQVQAFDVNGRYGLPSEISVFDVKDVTAPTLGKVTAALDKYAGTISWSGSDNVGVSKYIVSCAGQTQTVTGTSAVFENLAVGRFNVTVQAFDAAGNVSKVGKVSITVKDATPPEKVVGLATPTVDAKYSAMLGWAPGVDNSGKIASYEIRLDNGKILKSSKNSLKVSKLSVGSHTYQVRAIDKDKNIGEWSEVQTFTVKDMTAPTSVKAQATVSGYSVSFALDGKDNSGCIAKYVVTCGDKSVETATGTAILSDFGVGKQTAYVVAYDAEGNASKATKVSFTVKDATPPEQVTGLAVPVADSKYKATLLWNPGVDNSGVIATYEVKLDNGKVFKTNKTSLAVSNLSVGPHTYQVRAIDKDKNIGEWSEVQTFTVKDMTAPATVSVKAKVEGNSLLLNWTIPKDNVGVTGYILRYGVDLEKTETLTAAQLSFRIDGIAKGNYQYELTAFDAEGNLSKAKSGKATIKNELPAAAAAEWPLEDFSAAMSLEFDSGATAAPVAAGQLRMDDPLALCSVLRTENALRLTSAELFGSGNEKKLSPLLAMVS